MEVKQLEREADHSPPSTAKIKNVWSFISTPTVFYWHGALCSSGANVFFIVNVGLYFFQALVLSK
jgi:hypothetical protein